MLQLRARLRDEPVTRIDVDVVVRPSIFLVDKTQSLVARCIVMPRKL